MGMKTESGIQNSGVRRWLGTANLHLSALMSGDERFASVLGSRISGLELISVIREICG